MKTHALLTYALKRLRRTIPGSIVVTALLVLLSTLGKASTIPIWLLFAGAMLMIITINVTTDCTNISAIFGIASQSIAKVLLAISLISAAYLAILVQIWLRLAAELIDQGTPAIFTGNAANHLVANLTLLGTAIWMAISLTILFINRNQRKDVRPAWHILTTGFIAGIVLSAALTLEIMAINWFLAIKAPVVVVLILLLISPLLIFGFAMRSSRTTQARN